MFYVLLVESNMVFVWRVCRCDGNILVASTHGRMPPIWLWAGTGYFPHNQIILLRRLALSISRHVLPASPRHTQNLLFKKYRTLVHAQTRFFAPIISLCTLDARAGATCNLRSCGENIAQARTHLYTCINDILSPQNKARPRLYAWSCC